MGRPPGFNMSIDQREYLALLGELKLAIESLKLYGHSHIERAGIDDPLKELLRLAQNVATSPNESESPTAIMEPEDDRTHGVEKDKAQDSEAPDDTWAEFEHQPDGGVDQIIESQMPDDIPEEYMETAELDMKKDSLERIGGEVAGCHKCELSKTRTNTVFGVGSPKAQLMFIGEAPGADEDKQGEPFVGRAGKLLTDMIKAMGLERNDVYIANILKCRPPKNRDPEPAEVEVCEPYLKRQIAQIKPRIICALGRVSAQTLLRSKTPISKLRGSFHKYEGIDLLPTFHPAYLLRNPAAKKDAWADLQMIMTELGLQGKD
jgi:DNA polymerase